VPEESLHAPAGISSVRVRLKWTFIEGDLLWKTFGSFGMFMSGTMGNRHEKLIATTLLSVTSLPCVAANCDGVDCTLSEVI
jgi:hypothetical protein